MWARQSERGEGVMEDVWRDGDVLVVQKGASLPGRCVRCNADTRGTTLKQDYQWHHPALYILVVFGVLLYVIVAMSVRKTTTLQIGVCPNHVSSRKKGVLGSWALAIAGAFSLFAAIEGGSVFGWTGLL